MKGGMETKGFLGSELVVECFLRLTLGDPTRAVARHTSVYKRCSGDGEISHGYQLRPSRQLRRCPIEYYQTIGCAPSVAVRAFESLKL